LQRRKAEVDRAKDRIHKLIVRKIDFRPHARELSRTSAVLGRQFDEHAWSLVATTSPSSTQPSSGDDSTRSSGMDPYVEQSRIFCRTASDAAMAQLLVNRGGLRTPGVGALVDRLADLRGASVAGKGPIPTTREPERSTPPRLNFVDDAEVAGLQFVFD